MHIFILLNQNPIGKKAFRQLNKQTKDRQMRLMGKKSDNNKLTDEKDMRSCGHKDGQKDG